MGDISYVLIKKPPIDVTCERMKKEERKEKQEAFFFSDARQFSHFFFSEDDRKMGFGGFVLWGKEKEFALCADGNETAHRRCLTDNGTFFFASAEVGVAYSADPGKTSEAIKESINQAEN